MLKTGVISLFFSLSVNALAQETKWWTHEIEFSPGELQRMENLLPAPEKTALKLASGFAVICGGENCAVGASPLQSPLTLDAVQNNRRLMKGGWILFHRKHFLAIKAMIEKVQGTNRTESIDEMNLYCQSSGCKLRVKVE